MDSALQSGPAGTSSAEARTLPVDVEHAGVRFGVPFAALAGGVLVFLVASAILNGADTTASFTCIALIIAGIGGVITAAFADRFLKRLWPSRRQLRVDDAGLHLIDRRRSAESVQRIAWDARINAIAWRFTVKRGSARINKGFIMLGCQLVQDETSVILYTFAPSDDADAPRYKDFVQLMPRTVVAKGDLPLREANRQRRLLRLEDERWEDGAELLAADFAYVIDRLEAHQPIWQEQP
ncbi:MAG: hypothetical protein IT323_15525 [Anaerolineae bacterium]|nr:hypothetical protein [Anaerolineae bacterium]